MGKFSLFGKFTVEVSNQEKLAAILVEAAESMEAVEGCTIYLVSVSPDEPDAVYVYEVWDDEAAHQNSLTLEVTQTLISKARPLITGMERIRTLETLGGKGFEL